MRPGRNYHEDLIKDLKNRKEAATYLNAALESGDKKAFLLALRNVLEAQGGMTRIARRTKLNRVSLYKMLSKGGNPALENIMSLLNVIGAKFQVTTKKESRYKKAA